MTRITATEARELAGPTVEERLGPVYDLIREAATAKQREAHLKDDFWARGGYDQNPEYTKAVKILENDGFKVRFFYQESQFVDMYTIVEW